MAVKDPNQRPFLVDENNNIFVGLDLPIRKGDGPEGFFASTKTTLKAVKNNIKALLLTETGERLMQPALGLNLKKYLFEQFDENMKSKVQTEIIDKFRYWLPFVEIKDISISMGNSGDIGGNTMNINITFNITKEPGSLNSINVNITQ